MTERPPRIPEEEALALWRRAAELQLLAERSATALPPTRAADDSGLSLEQVAAAAEGAGIGPDWVRLALAERRLPDADRIRPEDWRARWLRRLVSPVDAIQLSRRIAATPQRVLATFHAVATRAPFGLALENRVGDDPLRDAVMVYRTAAQTTSSPFTWAVEWADIRVVLITIRPDDDGTRILLRAPLFRRGINLALTGGATGVVGAGGAWTGSALGAGLSALGIAAGGVLAGVGAVVGGAAGVAAYRALYRSAVRSGEGALRGLMDAVALETEHHLDALTPETEAP